MADTALTNLQDALNLTDAELGQLLGVEGSVAVAWRDDGIPPASQARCAVILSAIDALQGKVRPELLAHAVRRPVPALEGQTILEALASGPAATADLIDRSLDWSGTA